MQSAALLARFDFTNSWILGLEILPSAVVLDCDLRLVSELPQRQYQRVRLKLDQPSGLRVDFTFPKVPLPSSSDDIGSIDHFAVTGPLDTASLELESSYGLIRAESCRLVAEILAEPDQAEE